MLRAPEAAHPERASDALIVLGALAEERGNDSAGVALFTGRAVAAGAPAPVGRTDVSLDGVRVVKDCARFSEVWRSDLLPLLDHAPIVLGHTRRATQGSPYELVNAGPMVVGSGARSIVAAHNGDVDAARLRAGFGLAPGVGGTDSEVIFQALAGRRTPDEITALLGALVGRAALVWVERARPDRVHVARAALSPLTVAVDTEQNFYWASNPRWFREVERNTQVRFATAVLLREGSYLRIDRGQRPHLAARAEFVPTARAVDLDERVWAGFTETDMRADRAGLRHLVHRPSVGGNTGGFPIPA